MKIFAMSDNDILNLVFGLEDKSYYDFLKRPIKDVVLEVLAKNNAAVSGVSQQVRNKKVVRVDKELTVSRDFLEKAALDSSSPIMNFGLHDEQHRSLTIDGKKYSLGLKGYQIRGEKSIYLDLQFEGKRIAAGTRNFDYSDLIDIIRKSYKYMIKDSDILDFVREFEEKDYYAFLVKPIKDVLLEVLADNAAAVSPDSTITGGIDLGSGNYLKVISTDAAGMPQFDPAQIQQLQKDLSGLVPVPVGVPQPVNLRPLLGLSDIEVQAG
ncbi:MAG: hypothetical protein HQK92_12240 [Nitrospirae bacterium]|nr:hypothetical protein [Nitrospirota bacterium]